ncbi:MAG: DUF3098 domain-containing protein [Candidatus Kapaibacteriota bacterium]|jgi:hypothetical protein
MGKQVKGRKVEIKKKVKSPWTFSIDKENMKWFAIGLGVVAVGYILLATGITEEPALPQGKWNNPLVIYIAPIVLVIGYLVVIPYAILKKNKKKQED